jgi:hypothetical protein
MATVRRLFGRKIFKIEIFRFAQNNREGGLFRTLPNSLPDEGNLLPELLQIFLEQAREINYVIPKLTIDTSSFIKYSR